MYQVTHKNGERFSAAKAYLTPNLGRPNLKVITGAHTTRILMEGKRAVGVEVRIGGDAAAAEGAARGAAVRRRAAVAADADAVGHRPGRAPAAARHRRACTTCPAWAQHLHDHVDVVLVVDAPQLKDLFGMSPRRHGATPSRASSNGGASAAAC